MVTGRSNMSVLQTLNILHQFALKYLERYIMFVYIVGVKGK